MAYHKNAMLLIVAEQLRPYSVVAELARHKFRASSIESQTKMKQNKEPDDRPCASCSLEGEHIDYNVLASNS